MTGGYIAVRHLSGDGCAHHCHKNFGGCSPMTCGIPSGHHWKRVAPPPEPRRNTDPKPTTYAEWEDLEEERDQLRAHRDRLAAELARVRRNHLRRMEHDAIDLTCGPFRFTPRDHARLNRIIEGCRAALAQPQDGTTEGRG